MLNRTRIAHFSFLPSIYYLRFTIYYRPEVIRYSQHDYGLTFAVRVVPRASRSEIAGEYNGALRVRLAAAAVEGEANKELTRTLARALRLPQNAVKIISGTHSKSKIVRIQGAEAARLEQLVSSKISPEFKETED